MTPRVLPDAERRAGMDGRSSYAEFRSRRSATGSFSTAASVFWKYMTEPAVLAPVANEFGPTRLATMDDAEQRVLSKASARPAATWFLRISATRCPRCVVPAL